MNKSLKFAHAYVEAISKLDKVTTTRLDDDKNLAIGDLVDFIDSETNQKFMEGKVTGIQETSFEEMTKGAADTQGMYNQYKVYYSRDIKPDDTVKWIEFEVIK